MPTPFLSIVLPAYNETAAIRAGSLREVSAWAASSGIITEIIVVDDGSTDGTAELVEAMDGITLIRQEHQGKAAALIAGIRASTGVYVALCDMDQSTPIAELPRLLDQAAAGADVVMGNRGMRRNGAGWVRQILSRGAVIARDLLLSLPYPDTQCGFKLVRRKAAALILKDLWLYHPSQCGREDGANVSSGFDVEFLLVARRLDFHVVSVPVKWCHHSSGRVRFYRDAWRGMRDLIYLRIHYGS